jgi:hypothetical protein
MESAISKTHSESRTTPIVNVTDRLVAILMIVSRGR